MKEYLATVSSIALIANLLASPANAACAHTPEASDTLVRGRFVRCEDAAFYLSAAGAFERYERDLEAAMSGSDLASPQEFFERAGGTWTPDWPYDAFTENRVVVVAVDWHASIVPWLPGASESVEFKTEPRESREALRYWWRGSMAACEAMAELATVDLWVSEPCCDTPAFGEPACKIWMNYAEPAPEAMSAALSAVIDD